MTKLWGQFASWYKNWRWCDLNTLFTSLPFIYDGKLCNVFHRECVPKWEEDKINGNSIT